MEKERERNINVWLSLTHPSPGAWPATQACAPTENQTSNTGSQAHAQSTELHQPVYCFPFNIQIIFHGVGVTPFIYPFTH